MSAPFFVRRKNAPQKICGALNKRIGMAFALALLPSTPRCQPERMLVPPSMRKNEQRSLSLPRRTSFRPLRPFAHIHNRLVCR